MRFVRLGGDLQSAEEDEAQMPGSATAQFLNSSEFDTTDRMAIGLHNELDLSHDEVADNNIYDRRCRLAEMRGFVKGFPPRVELAAVAADGAPTLFSMGLQSNPVHTSEPKRGVGRQGLAIRADLSKGVVFQPRRETARHCSKEIGRSSSQLQSLAQKRACSFADDIDASTDSCELASSIQTSSDGKYDTTFTYRRRKKAKNFRKRRSAAYDIVGAV